MISPREIKDYKKRIAKLKWCMKITNHHKKVKRAKNKKRVADAPKNEDTFRGQNGLLKNIL